MAAPVYFKFQSCCTGEILYFQGPADTTEPIWNMVAGQEVLSYDPAGVYGDNFGLTSKSCYLVSVMPGSGAIYPTLLNGWIQVTDGRTECLVSGLPFAECKKCPCYLIVTCDGSLEPVATTQDLSAYLGQSIVLVGSDFPEKCVQIILAPPFFNCEFITSPLSYVEDCECPCNCYTVIANSKDCYYLDCDGNFQNTGPLTGTLIKIPCSSTTPWIHGNQWPQPFYINNIGPCINGECLIECFKLEDCDGIQDPIYATNVSLGQYAVLNQIVIIDGYPDTCWIVDSTVDCECAIDIVVLKAYEDCNTCKNPSKYKLVNCADSNTIVYTSSDLSAFVGQVIIRGECPSCWLVEEIEDIPSDVVVTVSFAYTNCTECERKYYELTDCTGFKDPIITYTDLSQYLGSVIKIKYCPETCWTVNATNDPTNAGIVIPDLEYVDCLRCILSFPCICTTVRNDSLSDKEYKYYDCLGNLQTFTLESKQTSEKFCMKLWAHNYPKSDYIETFGDCIFDLNSLNRVLVCPPTIYPRRSVRPGYNTPACTIDKYEKISCKSAQVYYKQVLNLRYGIADCCPDDNIKWLIKKELIDMDAQRDPNYDCIASPCCCPNTPSCGETPCGCTPLIPCDSH